MRPHRGVAFGIITFVIVFLGAPFAITLAKPKRENVHRSDADCTSCHTTDRAKLERDTVAARNLLLPDVDARCNTCHDDEGPSHRTGIPPHAPVPETLPLSSNGTLACATCHFVHGERDPFGDFVRIDNSRGGLCLTCHKLEELH